MINQIVVQKAVAKLVYDLGFAKVKDEAERATNDEHLQTLLAGLNEVDFGHNNLLWRFYSDPSSSHAIALRSRGIDDFLMRAEDGSVSPKDLGSYADGRFLFSVKHNDIYPVIADLIRFELNLPAKAR